MIEDLVSWALNVDYQAGISGGILRFLGRRLLYVLSRLLGLLPELLRREAINPRTFVSHPSCTGVLDLVFLGYIFAWPITNTTIIEDDSPLQSGRNAFSPVW